MADVKKRTPWDKDRAVQLWLDGKTRTEIATIIGGITRNAVLGHIFRMGLMDGVASERHAAGVKVLRATKKPRLPKPERHKAKPKKVQKPNQKLQTVSQSFKTYGLDDVVMTVHKAEVTTGFSIEELDSKQCRFAVSPHNVHKDAHVFCGKHCFDGQMYCSDHRPILYVTTYRQPRKAAQAKPVTIG